MSDYPLDANELKVWAGRVFDNAATPYFALIICLWGKMFSVLYIIIYHQIFLFYGQFAFGVRCFLYRNSFKIMFLLLMFSLLESEEIWMRLQNLYLRSPEENSSSY